MRRVFSCLLIVLLTFGLAVNEAAAKRFGGGRSFGVQRSHSSLYNSSSAQTTKSFGQRATNNKSKWGGVLGGLLAGGLLASLFMGNGLGSGLLSWLIVGSILFFLVGFLRRKMQPGFQSAQSNAFRQAPTFNQTVDSFKNNYQAQGNSSAYPSGFVAEEFLRDAKVKFIRLQAAYDQQNLADLTAFTAPEVFAEIKMQLEERGNEPNTTEVINLDAQLLDMSTQVDSTIASVRFTGAIKENDEPAQLDEIWHFRKFSNNPDWVVGGIQQEVL